MAGKSDMSISVLAAEIHDIALEKGWWDPKQPRTFGDLIALFHSELSEALEEFRSGKDLAVIYYQERARVLDEYGYNNTEPKGVPIELADVIIRILDVCEFYGIDMEYAIRCKMQFNARRPVRHGGKRI
jgi:NTP pyrophosphatase (non-canonical NTP hydrolase)